jgi:hypothetical protein
MLIPKQGFQILTIKNQNAIFPLKILFVSQL